MLSKSLRVAIRGALSGKRAVRKPLRINQMALSSASIFSVSGGTTPRGKKSTSERK